MKDKNGIEIKCENCDVKRECANWNYKEICQNHFEPNPQAYRARIRELQDELQVRVQLAERKEICAKENAEKLDAKKSEPKACDDCWLMRDFGRYIPAGYCANGKCAKIYNAFATESEVRK